MYAVFATKLRFGLIFVANQSCRTFHLFKKFRSLIVWEFRSAGVYINNGKKIVIK